jgi:hypothetical protein
MADEYRDPSGNTEAFRAFAQRPEATPEPAARSVLPFIIGGVVVAVVLITLVIVLLR